MNECGCQPECQESTALAGCACLCTVSIGLLLLPPLLLPMFSICLASLLYRYALLSSHCSSPRQRKLKGKEKYSVSGCAVCEIVSVGRCLPVTRIAKVKPRAGRGWRRARDGLVCQSGRLAGWQAGRLARWLGFGLPGWFGFGSPVSQPCQRVFFRESRPCPDDMQLPLWHRRLEPDCDLQPATWNPPCFIPARQVVTGVAMDVVEGQPPFRFPARRLAALLPCRLLPAACLLSCLPVT